MIDYVPFIVCAIFLLVIGGMVAYVVSQERMKTDVCERIGERFPNLEYYDHGLCKDYESDCNFRCKYIDENGDIVTKNVK